MVKPEEISAAIKLVREKSPKRKFKQTFDLGITLKDIDLKKPESKVKLEVLLPHGIGKEKNLGVIAEGELAEKAKKQNIKDIIGRSGLQKLAKDKKEARKLINRVDFFIAQPDLMIEIGKILGPILGPRDKMPKPINPKDDLKDILERFNKIVNLRVKEQPIISCAVGNESMEDKQIAENTEKVLTALKEKLPKGENQIKYAYLKLTMGPAIKIGAKIKQEKKWDQKQKSLNGK